MKKTQTQPEKNEKQFSQCTYSYGQLLISSLKTKDEPVKTFHETTLNTNNFTNSNFNKKKEIYDIYIELLRKLELIKFSIKNFKKDEKISETIFFFFFFLIN